MFTRTVSPDDLATLKEAREEADRRYNEALTAVDAAIQRVPEMPHAPPAPDESQIGPLNDRWNVVGDAGSPAAALGGWRARLGHFVWRLVAPYFERQRAFNSVVVDHINRNVAAQRETRNAIATTISVLESQLHALAAFESRLVVYLQQVTPYVDSKDHEFVSLGRRLHEDNRELVDLLDHRSVALGGAISGVGDELAKRWESMVVREQRYDAKAASLAAAHDELRQTLAIVQQAGSALKREVERVARLAVGGAGVAIPAEAGSHDDAATQRAAQARAGVPGGSVAPRATATDAQPGDSEFQQAQATGVDAYKYVGFEDRFRGSQDDIRARQESYLAYFAGASDVLDVGCGRGEFLDLLTANGIRCRGLDLNQEMVEVCRARGLDVQQGDAVSLLRAMPDGALGGLIALQVVEHLQPDHLLATLDLAYQKLRPGSTIILETINPACWFAFFTSYIRDITHVRPLHPDTLSYFVQASGFQKVTVQYSAPYPEHEKLQGVTGDDPASLTFNGNVEKLNRLMFTYLDYAVVGQRL
jgi:2-polyprenyl-3-methyl-5-hydroxy-6-metoxy-1,4-benzoquinol methylase